MSQEGRASATFSASAIPPAHAADAVDEDCARGHGQTDPQAARIRGGARLASARRAGAEERMAAAGGGALVAFTTALLLEKKRRC